MPLDLKPGDRVIIEQNDDLVHIKARGFIVSVSEPQPMRPKGRGQYRGPTERLFKVKLTEILEQNASVLKLGDVLRVFESSVTEVERPQ